METGRPVLLEHLSSARLEALAQSAEHLRALRALDPSSALILPLVVHGRVIGAMAVVASGGSRPFQPADVPLGEEIALRAAVAIENARLYRVAQSALRTRDEVLGIVAHDLRNPLAAILLQAGLLRQGRLPDRRSQRPAEAIERAARRMSRLLEDLLAVARLEFGQIAIERERVPVALLVAEAIDAQRGLFQAASTELRSEVEADVPDVCGDRDRLHQVFENLLGNALKFAPRSTIVVGARRHEDEVLFWVSDRGPGIDSEDVPHLFDRFWQARQAKRAGAGLGLAVVKGVVEAHGGRVWAESTLGEGTTFFFTVPAARRVEEPGAAECAPPRPREPAATAGLLGAR